MSIDAIPRAKTVAEASASSAASGSRPAAAISKKPGPFVQFEAFVLQNFIQSIMPQEASAVFGEGTAGEVWKSMLAEKIALQVAEAGGVGIAKMVAPKANTTSLPGSGAMTTTSAGQLIDMQAASTQDLAAMMSATGPSASSTNKSR